MKELNEVKKAIKYLELDAKEQADNFSESMIVSTKTILAIAEAFRTLEQRAEAAEADNLNYSELLSYHIDRQAKAEAKLAELERQEGDAVGVVVGTFGAGLKVTCYEGQRRPMLGTELFTRPATAINLAELVFPVDGLPDNAEESQDYRTGFAMGCACYAKRIVELNPHLVRNIGEAK